jgi:SAM-dependent methyltransferase
MATHANPDLIFKSQDIVPYHSRQFQEPYRSTVHLARFLKQLDLPPNADVLDVGCGAGSTMLHLSREFPGFRWTGVDYAGELLFPIGRRYIDTETMPINLITGDLFKLRDLFPDRPFDIVMSIQTLTFLPDYRLALEQHLGVTGHWLIVTSLFTDFDIDAKIEVTDFTREDGVREPEYFNVYSLRQFQAFCAARGFERVISADFEIDIDLAPPASAGRGTYTRRLEDGRRLQFSGPVALPWKFVAVSKDQ